MANFASELKSEISRIARKEIRAEILALKKASAQYRTDIAALKRRIAEQDRLITRLRKGKRPPLGTCAGGTSAKRQTANEPGKMAFAAVSGTRDKI